MFPFPILIDLGSYKFILCIHMLFRYGLCVCVSHMRTQ